ncbi:MAG: thiamine diphosphokinase [Clostridia bacterium]|nr:thiamine diphosphokinase [Clostridia bacterium]
MNFDCYIFTGGQIFADSLSELAPMPENDALIIAADSGYLSARRFGVVPDILVGDLDSLDRSKLGAHELDEMEKILVPSVKDDTDTQLAIDTAIARGAKNICIVGGLGGRLDHTLSSVFLLEYITRQGAGCMMTDGRNRVHIMCTHGDKQIITVERGYKYLSLVALSDVCRGVSVTGVFYPLDSVELTRRYSYAVSNEITAECAQISLCDGVMLVIESRD